MNILIAILGAQSQPEAMQAQRETWLRDLHTTDYKYFCGRPALLDMDVVSLDIPDGPIWTHHVGGPRTTVQLRKTEAIAKYGLDHGYDYVFKCDDDTYVRPELLLASGFEEHDYSGSTDRHYARDIGFYHWAQGGAGYWLSRRSMEVIVEHGLHLVPAEDFAAGQILARHDIHPHHDHRYIPGVSLEQLETASIDSNWITMHKVDPAWMRRLHERVGGFTGTPESAPQSVLSDEETV